jgi:hypothetical protein
MNVCSAFGRTAYTLVGMLTARKLALVLTLGLLITLPEYRLAGESKTEAAKTATRFDQLTEQRDYPELERLLPNASLSETDRTYFEGILANRHNELERSIDMLQSLVPKLKTAEPKRAAQALRTLADTFVKSFRYADAEKAFSDLLGSSYAKTLTAEERTSLKDDAGVNRLLTDAPPQKVVMAGSFTLPTHHSPIGTIDTQLTVNGMTSSWVLDTGANFSVVCESVARQMGLKLSDGTAQTQGSTGAENPLHTAIVPEMRIGTATVRNVVVLVLRDQDITIPLPKGKYRIDAILGYPVLSALGQLTFTSDNQFKVDAGGDTSGARLYMQQLNPLLEARIDGRDLLMFFDSGASGTTFTAKFYRAFPEKFMGLQKVRHGIGGAGGVKSVVAYKLPKVRVEIGGQTAVLRDVPLLTELLGTDQDLLYGTFGRDLPSAFSSFTLDFKAMRFRLSK